MRRRIVVGLRLVFAVGAVAGSVMGCKSIDPAWVADANLSPSKTSRIFVAPPSRVGPAMLAALDDLAVRVDTFQVRDSQQGTIVDLETTREDQRQPGAAFHNTEILSEGTHFANGIVGPDLLDGEVRRADGRTIRFASIEAIFSGKTPDNRLVVVTVKAQGRSTAVNISVGALGDPTLCRALFSGIEAQLSATEAANDPELRRSNVRKLGLTIATLLVTAATGCEMDIPLRRPTKPQVRTEQSGGVESDDMKTSAGAAADDPTTSRRISRDGVSNAQMFGSQAPVGYRDSPIQ